MFHFSINRSHRLITWMDTVCIYVYISKSIYIYILHISIICKHFYINTRYIFKFTLYIYINVYRYIHIHIYICICVCNMSINHRKDITKRFAYQHSPTHLGRGDLASGLYLELRRSGISDPSLASPTGWVLCLIYWMIKSDNSG